VDESGMISNHVGTYNRSENGARVIVCAHPTHTYSRGTNFELHRVTFLKDAIFGFAETFNDVWVWRIENGYNSLLENPYRFTFQNPVTL
jgi:hypothetical protein